MVLGRLYATRLALEEPHKVTHVINIASSPRFIEEAEWPGVFSDVLINFYHHLNDDYEALLQDFMSIHLNMSYGAFLPRFPPSPAGLAMGLNILDTWDLRERLNELKQPVSYMFGRLDPIVSVRTMHVMQERYPQFDYVLFPRAAHIPFISHKDIFIEHLHRIVS